MLLHPCTVWKWITRICVLPSSPTGFLYCRCWLRCPLAAAVIAIITTTCSCGERIQRKLRARSSTAFTPYLYPSSLFTVLPLPASLYLWQSYSSCCSANPPLLSLPLHHLETSVWADVEACRRIWHKNLCILWAIYSSFLPDCVCGVKQSQEQSSQSASVLA